MRSISHTITSPGARKRPEPIPTPAQVAGADDVAGDEWHDGTDVDDLLSHREDHLRRVGILLDHAVAGQAQSEVAGVVQGFEAGRLPTTTSSCCSRRRERPYWKRDRDEEGWRAEKADWSRQAEQDVA
jgi:hypothetical protein